MLEIKDVRFVKGAVRWAGLPKDGRPEVAFVGRSNVGKSSLLNMLLGKRGLARTSRTPGKTQEFNYFLVNDRMYVVDLPGLGYAKVARTERERWARFIVRYVTERESLRLVFHLVDARHPPTELDQQVMEHMRGTGVPYVILMTKCDKLSGNARIAGEKQVRATLEAYAMDVPVIQTSARTKRGREEVLNWIEAMVAEIG